jgi:hypothetical protein
MNRVVVWVAVLNVLFGLLTFSHPYAPLLSPFYSFIIAFTLSAGGIRLMASTLSGLPYYLAMCMSSWRYVLRSPESVHTYGLPPFDQF